jgi:EpsI family protein
MPEIKSFVPAALLGAGCLLISGVRQQLKVPPRAPMSAIAMEAPSGYSHRDIEVPAEERRVAGMSDYVHRVFRRDSLDAGFSVYVGYYDYQVQGKTIHSPKNCLPGAGWETLSGGVQTVEVGGRPVQLNRFLLANKGAQALVYYWYQGRGRIEASEIKVKLNLLRDAALHGRTEEALVRIVVPIDGRSIIGKPDQRAALAQAYTAADTVAARLARQLVVNVDRVLPVPAGS